jgi:hypothetical protein
MKYKYILNFWWAKDIHQVLEEHEKLSIDKLEFKYMKYPNPTKALDMLMKEGIFKPYDYIIFTSPDLVVKQENIDLLIKDIEDNDLDVCCGVCPVDSNNPVYKHLLATCYEPIEGMPTRKKYKWISTQNAPKGLHEVGFNGKVLIAIRIDKLEGYNFYDSMDDVPSDVKLCQWCKSKDIPIMCNFDNFMNHLRYTGLLQAGRKQPEIMINDRQIQMDVHPNNMLPKIPIEDRVLP